MRRPQRTLLGLGKVRAKMGCEFCGWLGRRLLLLLSTGILACRSLHSREDTTFTGPPLLSFLPLSASYYLSRRSCGYLGRCQSTSRLGPL